MTVIAKLSAARQVYGGLPLRTVLGMALQRAGATEIRALDPGTERTGFCAVAAEGWRAFTFPTLTIQHYLRQGSWGADRSEVAWMIERLSGQGRRAFPEVVQGAFVAGQFWECLAGRGRSVTMIYREAIRAKLLGNASKGERAGDSAIYRRLRVMAAGKVEREKLREAGNDGRAALALVVGFGLGAHVHSAVSQKTALCPPPADPEPAPAAAQGGE